MTPTAVRQWQGIVRDFVCLTVGASILIFETLKRSPDPLMVGAGLTLVGIPPVLRLDRSRSEEEDK